jgi:mannose-6-phosphate isomerase-like protein (cupin superfamily)
MSILLKVFLGFAIITSFQVSARLDISQTNKVIFESISSEDDHPIIVGPAGEIFDFIRTGKTTCGAFLLAKAIIPPGAGPLPHVHHYTNEWFYTPEKGIAIYMGESQYKEIKLAPDIIGRDDVHMKIMQDDELIYGPKYYIHGFFNTTEKDLILYFVWTPDTKETSILDYFIASGIQIGNVNEQYNISQVNAIKFVTLAPKYGINQSHDFWQYVKDVHFTTDKMDDNKAGLIELLQSMQKCNTF